ncbi:uncharacterized protein TNCV_2727591 [Trichonephila clavipes]|nr:uncharacterized protein TNCV_2727591 [Trichonephila clavipes]
MAVLLLMLVEIQRLLAEYGIHGFKSSTELRAGFQRPPTPSSPESKQVTRISLINHAATSRAMSQKLGLLARQQVRTVLLRLSQHGLSALRPYLGLPFRRESRFCLQHQDGHILIWRHRGACTLVVCIRYRHTGPTPDVMIRGDVGYTSWSPLVRSDGTLNSPRYISGVLRYRALPFI